MKTLLRSIILCILPVAAFAQQKDHKIIVLANPRQDSIVIRWAPASWVVWQSGNRHGYVVERFVIARDGKAVDLSPANMVKLTALPVKPFPEAQMEQMATTSDQVALVKEAIYSKEFRLTGPEKGIGDFITNRSEADMRFGFALLACDLSATAAAAAGLRFVDRSVKKNERYAYKISLAQQPKGLTIEPAVCVTSLQEVIRLSPPREFSIQFADSLARLQWMSNLDKGIYTAYMIERSQDGKKYTPVTDLPVIYSGEKPDHPFSYFTDSLANNETTYFYRVKGLTPFGESGPYSAVVSGQGAPAYEKPFIDSVASIDNKKIYLHWNLSPLLKTKTQSLVITRAAKAEGPYKDISPAFAKQTSSYIDEKPVADAYYRLKIKTTDGRTVYSLPQLGQVIDTIPPAMPVGVKGTVDSNGIVRLEWQANTETDLQGYRIFRANAAHEEFNEITSRLVRKTSFTDTIQVQTLSEKVLYRVVAVDKVFNPSEYSDTCTLTRPDRVPPSAPLFTYGRMQDSVAAVLLQWRTSSSEDVMKQVLYRVNPGIGSFNREIILTDSTNKLKEYLDTALHNGSTYYYELVAFDEAGNKSAARSGDIVCETGLRPAVKDIKAAADREKKEISLGWKYDRQPDVYYVYRSVNGSSYTLYRKITGDGALTDAAIKIGNSYAYKIRGEWMNGKTTIMSKPVTITY